MATTIEPYVSRVAPVQPSAPQIHLDTSIGDALQSVGSAISRFGDKQAALKKQRDAQNTMLGFQKLNVDADQARVVAQREAPANGEGIAHSFDQTFLQPETEKFLAGIKDPALKEEYTQRLAIFKEQHMNAAANSEYEQGNKFSGDAVNTYGANSAAAIVQSPTNIKAIEDDYAHFVDSQPLLTAAQRAEAKQKFSVVAPTILAETLKVNDPETLYHMTHNDPAGRKQYLLDNVMGVLPQVESGGVGGQVSSKGAHGMAQVLVPTAIQMAEKLGTPADHAFAAAPLVEQQRLLKMDSYSLRYGRAYMAEQLDRYHGDLEAALIAYNAGPARADQWLKDGRDWSKQGAWKGETMPYVAKIEGLMGTKAMAGMPRTQVSSSTPQITGARLPAVFHDQAGRQPVNSNIQPDVLNKWEQVQGALGKQVTIVSGFRDAKTNAAAGGADHSQHLHGNAIDLDVSSMSKADRIQLIQTASAAGFTGIGVYGNSIHLDLGTRRAWGPSHHGSSVPEWAHKVIATHLGRGYGDGSTLAADSSGGQGTAVASNDPGFTPVMGGSGDGGGVGRGASSSFVPAPSDVSSAFQGMSATQILELQGQSANAMKRTEAESAQYKQDQKEEALQLIRDDSASVLASGQRTIPVDQMQAVEDKLRTYGGLDEVNKWHHDIAVNGATYEATKNLGDLSVSKMSELVNSLKPKGGPNSAVEADVYANVVTKTEEELKKRAADPLSYVQFAPGIKELGAAAAANPGDMNAVESYLGAVKTKQEQIGLPFTPLSKDDAQRTAAYITQAMTQAAAAGNTADDAAKSVLSVLEKKYGGYADDVFVQSLAETMDTKVDKQTRQAMSATVLDWINAHPTAANPYNTIRNRGGDLSEMSNIDVATKAINTDPQPSTLDYFLKIGDSKDNTYPALDTAKALAKPFYDIGNKPGGKPAFAAPNRAAVPVAAPDAAAPAAAPVIPGMQGKAGPIKPFTIHGVDDSELNSLANNSGDPAVQARFRNNYGEDVFKSTMDLIKQRQGIK